MAPSWWEGKCPAHQGDEHSLIIHRGFDNRILLQCKAGCEIDKIFEAANITLKDFYGSLPSELKDFYGSLPTESMEDVVRRPRPVKVAPLKNGKHGEQTNRTQG